ncbi:MAG: hypothetical protein KKH51_14395 [Actinobacteria bacterium]|nr:hypothetical protein [Actinomycetota bacterium]
MVDDRYDPAFQRGYEPAPEALEGQPRRNPWLIALWILAFLLLAAGALLLSQSGTVTTGGIVPYFVLPAIALSLAPWLIGTGLAAVVGAVLVHALRWRE